MVDGQGRPLPFAVLVGRRDVRCRQGMVRDEHLALAGAVVFFRRAAHPDVDGAAGQGVEALDEALGRQGFELDDDARTVGKVIGQCLGQVAVHAAADRHDLVVFRPRSRSQAAAAGQGQHQQRSQEHHYGPFAL